MIRAVLLSALLASTAGAEALLTGEAFEAHIARDTISYGYSNGVRGTADYGPDRTLLWAFDGQPCLKGQWFPRGDEICFAFEDGTLSACWHMTLGPDGLQGTMTEPAPDALGPIRIFETTRSPAPLVCLPPDVGV
ncbi:MAG: hypothetical protein MUE83_09795 [Tabrizicola sp.]|jgi:hypothetical protein|nr:hypothetical protein [Tabrizicola sp.]